MGRRVVHIRMRSANWMSIISLSELIYFSYLVRKHVNQHFQKVLYGGLGDPKICNGSPQEPCQVLAKPGFDCLKVLMGNYCTPSTSSALDIFWIVKIFNGSEDSGAGRRRILVLSFKVAPRGCYGLCLNVPRYS